MAKKTAARAKRAVEHEPRTKARKTSRHVEGLLAMPRLERNAVFETADAEKLLGVFDETYLADLVNVLLDLKKATVRRFLEALGPLRKRGAADLATLYYYKEYLTNPLPLRVETEAGRSVPNYYAILGVPREASEEELKTAYRLLERAHDPESFSPAMRKAGAERLAEIQEAFENLKNSRRREVSDRLLPNISYLYPRRDQTWLDAVQRLSG